jgi:hypothetical protein
VTDKPGRKKGRTTAAPPEEGELDPRAAARALKAALAETDAATDEPLPESRPRRRRRPPTYHGPPAPRPRPKTIPIELDPEPMPPGAIQRHDLIVVLFALILLAAGAISYRTQTAVERRPLELLGLHLDRPASLLPPRELGGPPTGVAGDGTLLPYHVLYQSPGIAGLRLEIEIDERPSFSNLRAARALARASRFGEMLWTESSEDVKIRGRNWLRTDYVYAYKDHDFDSPKVNKAIELASLNGSLLYVVTAHGDPGAAEALAELVARSLAVDANHPAAAKVTPP